ncbi:MAG: hypothetical protein Fur0032_15090 [Terrimicrobiaceae bacterium]
MADWMARLTNPEFRAGDFLMPWGMVISVLGFLGAWAVVSLMESTGLTRQVWNLPLFFVALSVLLGCVIGLLLAP